MEARERLFDRERMATRFGGSKCEYCEKDIPEGAQIAYRRGEAPIHWDCWVEIVAKDHPQAMNDGALGPKDKVTDIAPTGPSPVLMPQSELDEITATVKASILPPDATDAELRLYLEICKSYHVHPLMRRMYAFRDPKGKLVVGVTIDGFLEIAERTGELVGFGAKGRTMGQLTGGIPACIKVTRHNVAGAPAFTAKCSKDDWGAEEASFDWLWDALRRHRDSMHPLGGKKEGA